MMVSTDDEYPDKLVTSGKESSGISGSSNVELPIKCGKSSTAQDSVSVSIIIEDGSSSLSVIADVGRSQGSRPAIGEVGDG